MTGLLITRGAYFPAGVAALPLPSEDAQARFTTARHRPSAGKTPC